MTDTYTIHDFEGTGNSASDFTDSSAFGCMQRSFFSCMLSGSVSEKGRWICRCKGVGKSVVAARGCRFDCFLSGAETGSANSDFRGIAGNLETAPEKDPTGGSICTPGRKKRNRKGAEKTESVQEEATSKKETVEQKAAVKKEQLSQKTVTEIQKTRDGSEERKRGEGESDPESVKTKKNVPERFWEFAGQLPGKLLEFAGRLLQVAFWILELPFRLVEKLEKKIQAGRRLKRKWRSMTTFLRSKMFREALFHAKKEVLYFLKKAAPKKVTGTVRFGFDDPALTGEALGVLGVIYGKLPKNLSIQPDFEQEILRGDVKLKGNFRMVTAAGIAFRIFRDQNIRKTMRHFKHKEA